MEKYINLIMGLVSGSALMLLNNDIVHNSLSTFIRFFDPMLENHVMIFILVWSSRLIIILSLIGIIITITCSFLIIRKVFKK